MSPSDLGHVLKPFVFLDLFDMEKASFPGFGLHPHSGIATVSYLFEGSVRASFDAQRGPNGALLIGSPDEVVDKILRHSEVWAASLGSRFK
jgi:Pirin